MGNAVPPPDGKDPFEWVRWFGRTDHEVVSLFRDVAVGVCLVVVIGLLLFGVSGVWPPMVAIESASMEPHMSVGDLVYVVEEGRLTSEYATKETGVVTYRTAKRLDVHEEFGTYGDVIIFENDGNGGTPTIHRAHFWVENGEDWYDKANPSYAPGGSCEAVLNCPAPHSGFITKGDNNGRYDQVTGQSKPVRPAWIRGRAEVRIPLLGHVRLEAEKLV